MNDSDSPIATPTTTPNSTIQVTHRKDRALITAAFQKLIRPFGPRLIKPGKEFPAGSPRLKPNSSASKKCKVTERKVNDIWIYDLSAKSGPRYGTNLTTQADDSLKRPYRIYYFAGGGWQSPPSSHHWKALSLLATQLPNSTISIISYPLSPNSPGPISIPQLLILYRTLLRESERKHEVVTLAGDSAGGNIVLALTIEALRQDPHGYRPHSLLAICPSVDLRRHNPRISEVAKHDPILRIPFINSTAEKWAGSWPAEDPRLSPLQADVAVLQRAGVLVDGVTAGYDILSPDALLFREKCEREGVEGQWLDWDKQMHCWPLAKVYGLFPESAQAWNWIVELLKKRALESKEY